MEVARPSLGRGVHVHRRDDDAVGQFEFAEAKGLEHRRADIPGRMPGATLVPGEPSLNGVGEVRVAQPQVVERDTAAAGEDVERELQRFLVHKLAEVLEPLQAGLRGTLRRDDDGLALLLIRGERGGQVVGLVESGGECERVLHRELGA